MIASIHPFCVLCCTQHCRLYYFLDLDSLLYNTVPLYNTNTVSIGDYRRISRLQFAHVIPMRNWWLWSWSAEGTWSLLYEGRKRCLPVCVTKRAWRSYGQLDVPSTLQSGVSTAIYCLKPEGDAACTRVYPGLVFLCIKHHQGQTRGNLQCSCGFRSSGM